MFWLPSVQWRDRHTLPQKPGIYFCYAGGRLLYVGESGNLHQRWTNNGGHGAHHRTAELEKYGCDRIHYRIILNKRRRLNAEAIAIRDHQPPLNRRVESVDELLETGDQIAVACGLLAIAFFGFHLIKIIFELFT